MSYHLSRKYFMFKWLEWTDYFYCYFDLFLSNCHVSTRILEHLFILSGNIFKYLNKLIAIKLYSPSDWLDRFSLSQTWLHLKYIKQKCFRKPISIVKNAKAFLDCDTNSTCRSVNVETLYMYTNTWNLGRAQGWDSLELSRLACFEIDRYRYAIR